MTTMTQPLGPGTKHLEALQRRHQSYAVKFVLDAAPGEEASDANLARVLANCARTPRDDEYPAIRQHVDTYRMAQMSATDAVRDTLTERAESYARDAVRFAEMANAWDVRRSDQAKNKRLAVMYRTIADELRKVAASL